jgi:NDP-sugar pyrophosphorylase family protein
MRAARTLMPAATIAMADIPAVILAGGLGTRLRRVVADRPKVLAEVGGRPFLSILLDQLVRSGVRSALLCTGYLGEQVEVRFGQRYGPLTLRYSRETTPLGTGGALRLAASHIDSSDVLVLNGDSYCDADLPGFTAWHRSHDSCASIVLVQVSDTRRFGRVAVDDSARIVRFSEKSADPGPALINAGIYLLKREVMDMIDPDRPVSLEIDVFPSMIGQGLYGFVSGASLWDIGLPESYERARSELPARVSS